MPLNPGGSEGTPDGAADNEGPHCRNCHTGASSCNQCHGTKSTGDPGWYWGVTTGTGSAQTKIYKPESDPGVNKAMPGGFGNPYQPQQYVHTSALVLDNGCLDGGFSWPHRTLGANLLKDELYGVDFDGTRIYTGDLRDETGYDLYNYGNLVFNSENVTHPYQTNLSEGNWYAGLDAYDAVAGTSLGGDIEIGAVASPSITTTTGTNPSYVENLDSVCIDCHGDATFWNPDAKYSKTYQGGVVGSGWMLHVKGLP